MTTTQQRSTDMVLIGPRQAGKTHIAVSIAVETAALGGDVFYETGGGPELQARFLDCVDRAELMFPDAIQRIYRSNGGQRILFHSPDGSTRGGKIVFSGRAFDYWQKIALHIIDDINAEARPNAERSIKTVTI